MQWDRTFDQRLESFLQISDGCFILTGDTGLKQDENILLVKNNPEGEKHWKKSFEGDTIHSVLQTLDGGSYVIG